MVEVFGATSTTEEVLSGVKLHGKRILVTGVSAGLGVETARSLAAHGAHVVGTARDLTKAEAATEQVRKDAAANGGSFELVELDLASLAASELRRSTAAKGRTVRCDHRQRGRDGHPVRPHDRRFRNAVRHQSPGPLRLREPDCAASARRRTAHQSGVLGAPLLERRSRRPNFETTPYDPFVAYGRSKTANILFAVAFDQRNRGRGVRAAAVHPGGIQTELGRHMDPGSFQGLVDQMNDQLAAEGKEPFQFKTIPQGAATSVWAAVVAPADEIGGRYCENCHVGNIVPDNVTISAISEGVRGYALDPKAAEALWKKSEELVGESF